MPEPERDGSDEVAAILNMLRNVFCTTTQIRLVVTVLMVQLVKLSTASHQIAGVAGTFGLIEAACLCQRERPALRHGVDDISQRSRSHFAALSLGVSPPVSPAVNKRNCSPMVQRVPWTPGAEDNMALAVGTPSQVYASNTNFLFSFFLQAVGQITSTASMAHNLGQCRTVIQKAVAAGAKVSHSLEH